jgi:hypothetical protein
VTVCNRVLGGEDGDRGASFTAMWMVENDRGGGGRGGMVGFKGCFGGRGGGGMLVVSGWDVEGVCGCLRPVCDKSYIAEGLKRRSEGVKEEAVRPGGHSVTILRYRVKHMRE